MCSLDETDNRAERALDPCDVLVAAAMIDRDAVRLHELLAAPELVEFWEGAGACGRGDVAELARKAVSIVVELSRRIPPEVHAYLDEKYAETNRKTQEQVWQVLERLPQSGR